MAEIKVDQHVQLVLDVPRLGLHRGEVGLVCSIWFTPATAYEVEFEQKTSHCMTRALLMPDQITGASENRMTGQ